MGLSLVVDDFKRVINYPKAIFVGLANQLILLPLIGFAIAIVFPVRPEIAIGIMILAACPGGPTSNLISHLAKADVALSVSLTALSSLITILSIPFIVNFTLTHFAEEGQIVKLDVGQTILQIFAIIVVPIVLGMLVRRNWPEFANKMEKPVRRISGIILALIILGIVFKEKENMSGYFEEAGLVALLLNVTTMLVGYYSSKFFKIPIKSATSIAIESGIQNGTLAITIAVVLLGNSEYAITAAIYSLIMYLTGGLVIYLATRKNDTVEVPI